MSSSIAMPLVTRIAVQVSCASVSGLLRSGRPPLDLARYCERTRSSTRSCWRERGREKESAEERHETADLAVRVSPSCSRGLASSRRLSSTRIPLGG